MSITETELQAIEARAAAASNGPWYKEKGGICGFSGQTYRVGSVQFTDRGGMNEANADFIVAAREDVPALVAEVRRLRGSLEDTGKRLEVLVEAVGWGKGAECLKEWEEAYQKALQKQDRPVPMCAEPTRIVNHCATCKYPTMTMVDKCDTCKRNEETKKPDLLEDLFPRGTGGGC